MKKTKVIATFLLVCILLASVVRLNTELAIFYAIRTDDISNLIDSNLLRAKYNRAVLAWNFATTHEAIGKDMQQALMQQAYFEMHEVAEVAPNYLDVNNVISLMEGARNVQP